RRAAGRARHPQGRRRAAGRARSHAARRRGGGGASGWAEGARSVRGGARAAARGVRAHLEEPARGRQPLERVGADGAGRYARAAHAAARHVGPPARDGPGLLLGAGPAAVVMPYLLLLLAIAGERLVELRVSARNAAWAFARGGIELGQAHFRVMRILHAAF